MPADSTAAAYRCVRLRVRGNRLQWRFGLHRSGDNMDAYNDESVNLMKRIELKDARNGRALCFAMHPLQGAVCIDRTPVERKPALETHDEEIVFGPPEGDESALVYLRKSHVNQARQMWGMPQL
jgi:hypothetical protein